MLDKLTERAAWPIAVAAIAAAMVITVVNHHHNNWATLTVWFLGVIYGRFAGLGAYLDRQKGYAAKLEADATEGHTK